MNYSNIKFDRNSNIDFYKTVQKKVRRYFKYNKITRFGNFSMVVKSIVMILLYLIPYILLMTLIDNVWLALAMWIVMSFGMAGIGLAIMHDANHGAYSKRKFVNKTMGWLINLVGGSDRVWRIQHNVLHHTYTNVTGLDEDIDPGSILRFSPHEEWKKFHKYQHIYAWFLYGMMTFSWITSKDFKQLFGYYKRGLINKEDKKRFGTWSVLVMSKVIYYGAFLVLPLIFAPVTWWVTLAGFGIMHYLTGTMLGLIFQTAHVMPTADYPMPNESGDIKADWAVSQLMNTADFAPKSKLLSWYIGGLNFQIEHHLFPGICHVHYKKIARIVKNTAKEYNLPYISEKTFVSALHSHYLMLKSLGKGHSTSLS